MGIAVFVLSLLTYTEIFSKAILTAYVNLAIGYVSKMTRHLPFILSEITVCMLPFQT